MEHSLKPIEGYSVTFYDIKNVNDLIISSSFSRVQNLIYMTLKDDIFGVFLVFHFCDTHLLISKMEH